MDVLSSKLESAEENITNGMLSMDNLFVKQFNFLEVSTDLISHFSLLKLYPFYCGNLSITCPLILIQAMCFLMLQSNPFHATI